MNKKRRQLPWDWKNRLEIVFYETEKKYDFVIQFIDGKEVKNFEKEIGTLSVHKKEPNYVSVVEISEYFRGRGLGKKLYIYAIKKIGKLSTKYYDSSSLAKRVWKSLVKTFDFETDFWNGRLTVFDKQKNGQKD